MSERLTPLHTWLRLPRDWFSDPRLITACENLGAVGAVGYLLLLSRGCTTARRFSDREEVAMAIRSHDCGIDSDAARRIAATLISVGLVTQDADGYAISDWRNFQPPRSTVTPAKREPLTALATSLTKSDDRLIEGRKEEKERERDGSAATPRFTVTANGIEVAILPEAVTATAAACSHGYSWKLRPEGQRKDGSTYEAFYAADHQVAGNWCKDRRPVARDE